MKHGENVNVRRMFGVAVIVALIAAAVAWHRFAQSDAPVGQSPLVAIDEEALEGVVPAAKRRSGASQLVFLTRGGCANTTVMRRNVDDALRSLGFAFGYEVVDLDTLATSDIRRGYPTPTLLYADRDVFGMPVPTPPLPDPT